jgi:hypothetical protein
MPVRGREGKLLCLRVVTIVEVSFDTPPVVWHNYSPAWSADEEVKLRVVDEPIIMP